MTDELQTFLYECYITTLDNGQQAMFQLFRNPNTGSVLHAQLAFKTLASGTWGVPYQCEVKP